MKIRPIAYTSYLAIFLISFLMVACNENKTADGEEQDQGKIFDPSQNYVEPGRLTPEKLWLMGRVSEPVLSPDGKQIVYTITYTDIAADKNYSDVYVQSLDEMYGHRVTSTSENEYQVGWTPDGSRITYLAARSKDAQVWSVMPDGSDLQQVTYIEGGVDAYKYSPDGRHMVVVKRIKLDQTVNDLYPDLPKANARIETDLMYRHWNEWGDYSYNHPLVVDVINGMQVGDPVDILEGQRYHSPMMPFGGIEQIEWSPDSKTVAYTCKKKLGKESALSTNSDIYLYDIEDRSTENLTEGNMGYDQNPKFSADGKRIFWQSMEHDGYESDKNRLMMLDLETGVKTDLTANTENDVNSYALSSDGLKVWAIMDVEAKDEIFSIDIDSAKIEILTRDICDYTSIADAGSKLVASRMSMKSPTEIYVVDKETGVSVNISNVNTAALLGLDMGNIESRWVMTDDGKLMQVWVLYPPQFDRNKKYPAILYCQGGPQSTVSQFWSTRWNLSLMAANDYIVVAPNRRGLPGFGREWCEEISGDYGGLCMKDYLAAIDNIAKESFVDENRLGAVGASFGGYSIYWLAGHHEKRFKAFIAHCGIFNFDQMYPTTEEMFFVNWDLKGPYWDKSNADVQKSYSQSPHLFVDKWDTPIMVIHGEKDFRIPYTQGMAAFNTAVMRDIPAQFLYYPDECHWVLHPQNNILWHREFYRWLDKWLK